MRKKRSIQQTYEHVFNIKMLTIALLSNFVTNIFIMFATWLVLFALNSVWCVHIMQVRVLLKWRLKLIVMISLSIHMMTSQDRICAQCVTNGLPQTNVCRLTKDATAETSHLCVPSATDDLHTETLWMFTHELTTEIGYIRAPSVRKVTQLSITCGNTWTYTAVRTCARSAASAVAATVNYWYTGDVIPERNRLNAALVANDSPRTEVSSLTGEFTAGTNRTGASFVTSCVRSTRVWRAMWECILARNHTRVRCVTKVSFSPATCIVTMFACTATKKSVSALTAECNSRRTVMSGVIKFACTTVRSDTNADMCKWSASSPLMDNIWDMIFVCR